jgi:hypothetical protein
MKCTMSTDRGSKSIPALRWRVPAGVPEYRW